MVTGTQIACLHLCHRKLWLFAHGINMEQSSELVAEGKFIDEHSYPQRAARWQALEIEGIKIDHYDGRREIPLWEAEVQRIIGLEDCPALVKKDICRKCAYCEFCFSE